MKGNINKRGIQMRYIHEPTRTHTHTHSHSHSHTHTYTSF